METTTEPPNTETQINRRSMPGEIVEDPPILAVERTGSAVAARTVRGGAGRGHRDTNPALKLLDRVQPETGRVGKKGLQMARGRSHLPLNDRTFLPFHVLGEFMPAKTCTEFAGEPKFTRR